MGSFYNWLLKEAKEDYLNHDFSLDSDPFFTVKASFDTAKDNDELDYWIDSVKRTAKKFRDYVDEIMEHLTDSSSPVGPISDDELNNTQVIKIREKLHNMIYCLNNVIFCNSTEDIRDIIKEKNNIKQFCISSIDVSNIGKFYLFKEEVRNKLNGIIDWLESLIEISNHAGHEIVKNIYKNHDDKEEYFLNKIKENKLKILSLINKLNFSKLNNNSKAILYEISNNLKNNYYLNKIYISPIENITKSKFDYIQLNRIYHEFEAVSPQLESLDIGQRTIQFKDIYNNFLNYIKSFIIAFHRKYGTLSKI